MKRAQREELKKSLSSIESGLVISNHRNSFTYVLICTSHSTFGYATKRDRIWFHAAFNPLPFIAEKHFSFFAIKEFERKAMENTKTMCDVFLENRLKQSSKKKMEWNETIYLNLFCSNCCIYRKWIGPQLGNDVARPSNGAVTDHGTCNKRPYNDYYRFTYSCLIVCVFLIISI